MWTLYRCAGGGYADFGPEMCVTISRLCHKTVTNRRTARRHPGGRPRRLQPPYRPGAQGRSVRIRVVVRRARALAAPRAGTHGGGVRRGDGRRPSPGHRAPLRLQHRHRAQGGRGARAARTPRGATGAPTDAPAQWVPPRGGWHGRAHAGPPRCRSRHAETGGRSHPRPQAPDRHRRSSGRRATARRPATYGSAVAHRESGFPCTCTPLSDARVRIGIDPRHSRSRSTFREPPLAHLLTGTFRTRTLTVSLLF